MRFAIFQESHLGARAMNQDRMGYSFTRDALLLVLADGMGGHPRGEVAATVALQTISALFQQQADPYIKGPGRFLEDACHAAHREIHRHAGAYGLAETPRTTIVACVVQHNTATWAHCGDSRLYWLRGGRLLARTRDHSHIEKLIDAGRVPASARETHPDRNKLYNCLGAGAAPKVELSEPARLAPGDVMLLCSDGLWAALPEQELVAGLSAGPVDSAVPQLLRAALRRAGAASDNVTGLAIGWQGASGIDDAAAGSIAGSTLVATGSSTGLSADPTADPTADSTAAAPPGAPHASTIVPADPFDEAEIDRAIAEIRQAIERSSRLLK